MCVLSLGLTVTCVYTDNSARTSDMTSRIGMRVRNGRRVGFGWCRCGHQMGRQQCRLANAIILNTAIKAAWTLGTAGSLQRARLTPAQCRKVTSTLLLCFTLNLLAILERLQQWRGSLAKNWKVKSKLFFSFLFFFGVQGGVFITYIRRRCRRRRNVLNVSTRVKCVGFIAFGKICNTLFYFYVS